MHTLTYIRIQIHNYMHTYPVVVDQRVAARPQAHSDMFGEPGAPSLAALRRGLVLTSPRRADDCG